MIQLGGPAQVSRAVVAGNGPAKGFGNYAFTGFHGALTQTMSQTIDLSDNSAMIDDGEIASIFSINLQSRSNGSALDTANAKNILSRWFWKCIRFCVVCR